MYMSMSSWNGPSHKKEICEPKCECAKPGSHCRCQWRSVRVYKEVTCGEIAGPGDVPRRDMVSARGARPVTAVIKPRARGALTPTS